MKGKNIKSKRITKERVEVIRDMKGKLFLEVENQVLDRGFMAVLVKK